MTLPEILSFLTIFIAVPLNWAVFFGLWRELTLYPKVRVLRERTLVQLGLSAVVTIFSLVFLNNNMEIPILDLVATQLFTRTSILALTIPAVYWLWLYRIKK